MNVEWDKVEYAFYKVVINTKPYMLESFTTIRITGTFQVPNTWYTQDTFQILHLFLTAIR